MKKPRFKNWRLLATLALLSQTIGGAIGPTIAPADEITHPQTVVKYLNDVEKVTNSFQYNLLLSKEENWKIIE